MAEDKQRTRSARTPAALRKSAPQGTVPDLEPSPAPAAGARADGVSVEGVRLGSYVLVRQLGAGGMGKVYLARHARLGRAVAIKTLHTEFARDREAVARFFNEARTVNAINHEHIVEIFDFVEEEGDPPQVYCVLELLHGESLSKVLKGGPLQLARIVDIGHQIAEALAAAHRAGVIHRDIKPGNILLTERGGRRDFVKVLDFGIAKITGRLEGREELSTRTGLALGTPEYMAPEQALAKPVDHRADIYALGLTLYEMLAGRRPFDAESVAQLLVQLVTEPPSPLPGRTATGEAIPPRLAELVMRCLKKSPDERPGSMEEVIAALDGIVPRGNTGAFEPAAVPATPAPRRSVWMGACAALLVVAGIGVWRYVPRTPAPALPAAVRPSAPPSAPTAAVAHASATPPAATAPAAGPPPSVAAATGPAKPAVSAPSLPDQVTLAVTSTPPRAQVIRADTGEVLGLTPLELKVPRAGPMRLRLVKSGFTPSNHQIRLSEDIHLNVTLRQATPPVSPEPKRRPHGPAHPMDRDSQLDPFATP